MPLQQTGCELVNEQVPGRTREALEKLDTSAAAVSLDDQFDRREQLHGCQREASQNGQRDRQAPPGHAASRGQCQGDCDDRQQQDRQDRVGGNLEMAGQQLHAQHQ